LTKPKPLQCILSGQITRAPTWCFPPKGRSCQQTRLRPPITDPPKVKLLMSWLTTLLAHSCLPGCTGSFLEALPLPLPYPHPPPLPPPPHCHLIAPWPPMPHLWMFVMSPCSLHHSVDVCGCIIIICVVACHLGGSVIVCVFVRHLRHHPLSALWYRCPLSASQRCYVHRCPLSALRRRCLQLPCHCHLHCGNVVCIILCVVVCSIVVCIIVVCTVIVCIAGVVPPPPLSLPYPHPPPLPPPPHCAMASCANFLAGCCITLSSLSRC
jgi:hypothetical protein